MSQSTAPAPAPATISREEHRALLNHHMAKIREANTAVDLARAPFDAARENLTGVIDQARADLGKKAYTRKRLLSYLEDLGARLRNLMQEEEQRFRDRQDLGLPVFGEQQSLFGGDETPQEAKDELTWEAEGYLFGRRAAERKPPEGCPPRFAQHFLKGFDRGQDENGRLFIQANEVKKRLAEPAADQKPVELNGEPEPGTTEAKAAERKAVAAAKAGLDKLKGKTAADDFQASDAELAQQKPRAAVVQTKAEAEPLPVH
jgi:hypothetical protein